MTTVAITSMTGFARAEGRLAGPSPLAWVWEAKSVNGKNLDARVRVPHGYDSLESPARAAASTLFVRGSISLNLTTAVEGAQRENAIDMTTLDALVALAAKKASTFDEAAQSAIDPARLDGLMALALTRAAPEVLSDTALAARDAALLAGLKVALERLALARRQEGERLGVVVAGHIDTIATLCDEAGSLAASQPQAVKARLLAQIAELTAAVPALAPERLAQEAVLLAVKSDVREELDRLAAHVAQARGILAKGEPCGRKLDFLSQEFNREANTLCSKSADLALTRVGLALKSTIDQFREQIQNIE